MQRLKIIGEPSTSRSRRSGHQLREGGWKEQSLGKIWLEQAPGWIPTVQYSQRSSAVWSKGSNCGNLCQRRLKQHCRWFVFYLRGEVTNFHIHQQRACHEGRFISDALYILALRMTEKVSMIMNTERKNIVKNAAFFIPICYAPWFLKSYLVGKSTSNDINAIKSAFHTS